MTSNDWILTIIFPNGGIEIVYFRNAFLNILR